MLYAVCCACATITTTTTTPSPTKTTPYSSFSSTSSYFSCYYYYHTLLCTLLYYTELLARSLPISYSHPPFSSRITDSLSTYPAPSLYVRSPGGRIALVVFHSHKAISRTHTHTVEPHHHARPAYRKASPASIPVVEVPMMSQWRKVHRPSCGFL